ncbi:hypothetical protein D3C86_1494110 [compost metagenome]
MPHTCLQLINHQAYFLSGLLSTKGQGAHLVGHHGETASRFTGTCRLDGGIEREKIGLVGDAGDDRHDRFDALTERGQFINRMTGVVHLVSQTLDRPR